LGIARATGRPTGGVHGRRRRGQPTVEEAQGRPEALAGGSRREGHGGLYGEEAKRWAVELGRRLSGQGPRIGASKVRPTAVRLSTRQRALGRVENEGRERQTRRRERCSAQQRS
jgi:hypothetical protein